MRIAAVIGVAVVLVVAGTVAARSTPQPLLPDPVTLTDRPSPDLGAGGFEVVPPVVEFGEDDVDGNDSDRDDAGPDDGRAGDDASDRGDGDVGATDDQPVTTPGDDDDDPDDGDDDDDDGDGDDDDDDDDDGDDDDDDDD